MKTTASRLCGKQGICTNVVKSGKTCQAGNRNQVEIAGELQYKQLVVKVG